MTSIGTKQASRLLRAVAALVLGVLAIVALLLVLLGIFARPGSDGISRIHGHPILTVLSGSMRGVFDPGDLIVDNSISPADTQRLATGNIITFHVANASSNNLITHRIVAVNRAAGQVTYQTKGDANNAPDPESVAPAQIVGIYRNHIPYGGYLLQWAQQKLVFFVIIIVPVIFLVAMEIAKHWNEPDKGKDAEATGDSAADADDMAAEASDDAQPAMAGAPTAARHRHRAYSERPNDGRHLAPPGDGAVVREGD